MSNVEHTHRHNCDRRQRRGEVAQQGAQRIRPHVWALSVHQQPAQGAQVPAKAYGVDGTGWVSPGLAGAAACADMAARGVDQWAAWLPVEPLQAFLGVVPVSGCD